MGFKTKNLFIDEFGEMLEDAYAIVNEINVSGTSGYAVFNIQKDRDSALSKRPYKQVQVTLRNIKRDEPLLPQIYAQAKAKGTYERWDNETKQMVKKTYDMYFTNWDDDIDCYGGGV